MFNLKNRYPIGIDINDDNIYAAQFQKTKTGIAIRELFHRKLDRGQTDSAEPDDALVPILREIAKNRRFRGKSAAIHLPARHVYSFPVTFEIGAEETLEDAIVRECRRHLSFPLEEAVIDYPSIVDISSGTNKKFNAIIIAVRRDQIEQYSLLLKQAGLSVEVIDFSLSSLLRLHNYLFSIADDPLILCNIGHNQSLIAIVTKNSILAQRNISWGIKHLLSHLDINLELSGDSEKALGILKKYGLYYEHQISSDSDESAEKDDDIEIYRTVFQILTPHIDGLIHEIYQITGYVRSEMQKIRFEEISLYGQASSINFLDRYIQKKFDIPTKSINPMIKLSRLDNSLLPGTVEVAPFALALGLAMRKVTWL
ncbi:MAG: pilus assembly protein PilM [Desulfobacterales bacterium]|nr:MAG: pilus assembly protein PilM [Desulfobacterales bacterium]